MTREVQRVTALERDSDDVADLFQQHHRVVRTAARRIVGAADADDLVTETFLIAARRRADIPPGREQAWLVGVARNLARTLGRAQRRHASASERMVASYRVVHADLNDGRLSIELVDHFARACMSLSEGDRVVLRMWIDCELTVAEIAMRLGISGNAAAVRLHRARRRLAVAMARAEPGS